MSINTAQWHMSYQHSTTQCHPTAHVYQHSTTHCHLTTHVYQHSTTQCHLTAHVYQHNTLSPYYTERVSVNAANVSHITLKGSYCSSYATNLKSFIIIVTECIVYMFRAMTL